MATGLVPAPSWADAGSPAYLSAAALPDGSYALCGISAQRDILFRLSLPDRGHAAAAHPTRPQAVAFARRPGTFAIVIDCATGHAKATLTAPKGRHFYGHGAFSQDGDWLFTTENDYESGTGRIGVWDAANDYARVAEFSSGGIGPHDIKRLPDTDILVVANGGIDTHPDSGRTKLNIPTMAPNLAYIDAGQITETAALPREWHKNSIRHLAVSKQGQVAFGMQWQGDADSPPLVGLHTRGTAPETLQSPPDALRQMQGYIGSIAFTQDDTRIVATSPRGGLVQTFSTQDRTLISSTRRPDACGVAPSPHGVLISSGTGLLAHLDQGETDDHLAKGLQWDNHLIAV